MSIISGTAQLHAKLVATYMLSRAKCLLRIICCSDKYSTRCCIFAEKGDKEKVALFEVLQETPTGQ
jgi:hypothetical protein